VEFVTAAAGKEECRSREEHGQTGVIPWGLGLKHPNNLLYEEIEQVL
jgi:hypothetical protein